MGSNLQNKTGSKLNQNQTHNVNSNHESCSGQFLGPANKQHLSRKKQQKDDQGQEYSLMFFRAKLILCVQSLVLAQSCSS